MNKDKNLITDQCDVKRSCIFCKHWKHEEIGDSDFGATYAKEATCEIYMDCDDEENPIPNFNTETEKDCCRLEYWKVIEHDAEVEAPFKEGEIISTEDYDKAFKKSYDVFCKKYNYA